MNSSSSSNPNQNNNNYHNPNPLQKKKSTGGKQKIPMEKIKNESSRQITFSKRKGGLVKKASELGTLTGAEIALVVFSSSGKPYAYGNPSLERVTSRWMYANAYTPDSMMPASNLTTQNEAITKFGAKVEVERNKRSELQSMETAAQLSGTYPPDLETLRYAELCALKTSILGFRRSLEAKVGSSSSPVAPRNQMVPEVLNSNLIKDNVNPNQGRYNQQRGQCSFATVVGSSSSSNSAQRNQMVHEVLNNNIVNDNVNPNNQCMYTSRFFNPGGFASYNPSSLRYGGSSSFAFPSNNNAAGQLASGNAINNDGGYRFCNPKELPFGGMRFPSHAPHLVHAGAGNNDADLLPKQDVVREETSAAPEKGQTE